MRRTRLLSVLLIVPALSLAMVACSDDESSADEDDITTVIEQGATTNDPANCTELQTQAFTEQTEFASGEEAVASCKENTGDDVAAESVEVSDIDVDGDTATAEAAFEGGSLGGQTIAISLVKEGDQWKLDSLDEFTTFDKDAFVEGLLAGAGEDDPPQGVLDCIEQAATGVSDEELQDIYLSGEPDQLFGLFAPCFQS